MEAELFALTLAALHALFLQQVRPTEFREQRLQLTGVGCDKRIKMCVCVAHTATTGATKLEVFFLFF